MVDVQGGELLVYRSVLEHFFSSWRIIPSQDLDTLVGSWLVFSPLRIGLPTPSKWPKWLIHGGPPLTVTTETSPGMIILLLLGEVSLSQGWRTWSYLTPPAPVYRNDEMARKTESWMIRCNPESFKKNNVHILPYWRQLYKRSIKSCVFYYWWCFFVNQVI